MPQPIERVNAPDDPRRCHGQVNGNQCWNVSCEESTLCPICSGGALAVAERQDYQLTDPKYQARLAVLSQDSETRTLTKEIAIAQMLLEEVLNRGMNQQDWYTATGKANALLLTIEKLVSRSHILKQNLGQLYHKATIVEMVQAFVQIVSEEVSDLPGGVEAKDRIIERVFGAMHAARNRERARGVKLLKGS